MSNGSELTKRLNSVAQRSVAVRAGCLNEESTKLQLVLPVLGALGYDFTDPHEVQPEYPADFRDDGQNRVDYVVLRDGVPIVAIECKSVGSDLVQSRGQLRSYFTALSTVKLGILTNGTLFEFFMDCEEPNVMDDEPFLTLDIDTMYSGNTTNEVLEMCSLLTKNEFDPALVAERAQFRLIQKRLKSLLHSEVRQPSEELCRLILQKVGLKHLRRSSIESHYSSLIRNAFEDTFILPVIEALRSSKSTVSQAPTGEAERTRSRIITTERELAIYHYTCRRLAFLSSDETYFAAIERVKFKDYIGKFAVYYSNINKGRLFDFVEGGNGYDKFIFPDGLGEVVTNSLADIDHPLREIFSRRVQDLGRDAGSWLSGRIASG